MSRRLAATLLALALGASLPAGAGAGDIEPADLARLLRTRDVALVNVHVPYDGEIDGTDAFVPFNAIEQNLGRFPAQRSATVVVYCRGGRMSEIAAETLGRLGYGNVQSLRGGMAAWEEAGYPLARRAR